MTQYLSFILHYTSLSSIYCASKCSHDEIFVFNPPVVAHFEPKHTKNSSSCLQCLHLS